MMQLSSLFSTLINKESEMYSALEVYAECINDLTGWHLMVEVTGEDRC